MRDSDFRLAVVVLLAAMVMAMHLAAFKVRDELRAINETLKQQTTNSKP